MASAAPPEPGKDTEDAHPNEWVEIRVSRHTVAEGEVNERIPIVYWLIGAALVTLGMLGALSELWVANEYFLTSGPLWRVVDEWLTEGLEVAVGSDGRVDNAEWQRVALWWNSTYLASSMSWAAELIVFCLAAVSWRSYRPHAKGRVVVLALGFLASAMMVGWLRGSRMLLVSLSPSSQDSCATYLLPATVLCAWFIMVIQQAVFFVSMVHDNMAIVSVVGAKLLLHSAALVLLVFIAFFTWIILAFLSDRSYECPKWLSPARGNSHPPPAGVTYPFGLDATLPENRMLVLDQLTAQGFFLYINGAVLVLLSCSFVLDAQNEVSLHRKRRAEAAAAALGQAIAYVSHEARGPLNAAALGLALLEAGDGNDAEDAALLDDVGTSVQAARRHLDDLLLWERAGLPAATKTGPGRGAGGASSAGVHPMQSGGSGRGANGAGDASAGVGGNVTRGASAGDGNGVGDAADGGNSGADDGGTWADPAPALIAEAAAAFDAACDQARSNLRGITARSPAHHRAGRRAL
ncbi:hypothetical protein FNF28_01784 [Cafeteria roenbergensis]|uniref:Signal transduction histidine kinase dimerisation/phosphoacceptor domain-containing protein n=1 Tax=Cafeteria roenbergensis TaxID=33653 RepID=A0A5A8DZ64_CAFRO|nr:hypothetical protein FNF28_01784 [Cafeteria roenbergensis]